MRSYPFDVVLKVDEDTNDLHVKVHSDPVAAFLDEDVKLLIITEIAVALGIEVEFA